MLESYESKTASRVLSMDATSTPVLISDSQRFLMITGFQSVAGLQAAGLTCDHKPPHTFALCSDRNSALSLGEIIKVT